MIVLFTVMLLVLLAIGLPVGFALGTGGMVGMLTGRGVAGYGALCVDQADP